MDATLPGSDSACEQLDWSPLAADLVLAVRSLSAERTIRAGACARGPEVTPTSPRPPLASSSIPPIWSVPCLSPGSPGRLSGPPAFLLRLPSTGWGLWRLSPGPSCCRASFRPAPAPAPPNHFALLLHSGSFYLGCLSHPMASPLSWPAIDIPPDCPSLSP